jgi:poly(3-hydroxybutyrate) depolymerase
MHVAILAPLFPAGPSGLESLNNYKLLRDDTLHADTAMIDILQEIKERWPGLATEEVFMIGFSGGGQFVHRFMYLYPNLLTAVSIGAPGRVTQLDYQHKWPAGIKDVADRFDGAVIDLDMIRKVPIQLVGGALDTETHGGEEFWEWLRAMKKGEKDSKDHSSAEDRERKTTNRVETLKRIKEDWQRQSIQCQLDIVDDAGHERQMVIHAVVEFLRPHIKRVSLKLEHGG